MKNRNCKTETKTGGYKHSQRLGVRINKSVRFFCRATGKIIVRQDFEEGAEVFKIGSQKCTIEGDTKMVVFVRNKSKTKVKSRHDDNFTE